MILVDTSVWIEHLRNTDEKLIHMLNAGQVLAHPFVIGELALGNLRNRDATLSCLKDLPPAVVASNDEVFAFIDQNALYGLGIGFVDAHLLASVRLSSGALLWTRDKRLLTASVRLGLADRISH